MKSQLVAVAAEQYSPRRLNPKWKEVVFTFLLRDRRKTLEDCGSLYRLWTCRENPQHKFVTRIGCKDPICYVCSFAKKQELVADRMEVLDRIYSELHEQVASSMFTFTTPSVMWEKLEDSPNSISYLEEFVREVLLEYFGGERCAPVEGQKRLKRYVVGGDVVGQWFHSFHPDRKGNVWRGFDAHVHASMYSVMFDRLAEVYTSDGLRKGAFVRRTLSLSRGEVRRMCYELGRMFKAKVEARYGKSGVSEWVVNYRYYPRRHDVQFMLEYMFRSEVQDAYREVVWNNCAPRDEAERSWFRRMLDVRRRGLHRYSGYGFMANAVLNRYARRVGLELKTKSQRLKARHRLFCDRCGGEMVTTWYDEDLTIYGVLSRGLSVVVHSSGGVDRGG